MASLPPSAEDLIEHFEWGLPNVQVLCFWLLHDLRYIDFQTGHFAHFEHLIVNSHSADFGQVKIELLVNIKGFGQFTVILLSLGKALGCEKLSKTPPLDKKNQNHA